MIDALLQPLASWLPMSALEFDATVFTLLGVWYCTKESIWNWPIGLIAVLLFLVVVWNQQLYADSGLQCVYIVLQLYGWWQWLYGGPQRTSLTISRTTPRLWLMLTVIGITTYIPMGLILDTYTSTDVPWWDSLPTVTSLVAQWMITRKKLENWWVWMGTDVIYLTLYCYKGLYLFAGLSVILFALCIQGYRSWHKTLRASAAA